MLDFMKVLTNKLSLPEPIVEAVKNDPYDKGNADMSITGLLTPPRIASLSEHYKDELVEDVSDNIYSLLGQLMHLLLERANKSGTVEKRLYMALAGWKISGQMDRIVYDQGRLQDYKFVTAYKVRDGLDTEYEKQLNGYAMLMRENGLQVKNAQIVAILRDWSKMEARRNPEYPQHQIVVQDVPLWPDKEARDFYSTRVKMHQAAKHRLPLCTPEERWEKPEKWAVMQKGVVKAKRLYDVKPAAEAHAKLLKGAFVEHRPGANIRCENYCPVAAHCKQFQKLNPVKFRELQASRSDLNKEKTNAC